MLKKIIFEASSTFKQEKVITENRHIGIIYTIIGWFLIALSSVFFAQTTSNHSIVNTCFHHYLASSMSVSLWVVFKNKKNVFCKNPILVVFNSLLCVICYYIFFSFKMSPASISNSYLLNSDPILVALALAFVFKQSISFLSWLGICLGFLGILSLYNFGIDFSTSRSLWDGFTCLLSASSFACLLIISKYLLKNNPPVVIALSHCLVGLFGSGALLYFTGWQMPSNLDLFCMIADGVIYGLALYFFITSLQYMELYIATALGYLLPVFLILINVGLLRAGFDTYTFVGVILILTSVPLVFIPAYLKDHKKREAGSVQ